MCEPAPRKSLVYVSVSSCSLLEGGFQTIKSSAKIHSISFHRVLDLPIFSIACHVIKGGKINAMLDPIKRNFSIKQNSLQISGSPDLIEKTEPERAASGNFANSPRQAWRATISRLIISLYTRTKMTFSRRRGRNAAYDGSYELTVQTHQGRVAFYRLIKTWSRRAARPRCGN
jgi:hypothetical protein